MVAIYREFQSPLKSSSPMNTSLPTLATYLALSRMPLDTR